MTTVSPYYNKEVTIAAAAPPPFFCPQDVQHSRMNQGASNFMTRVSRRFMFIQCFPRSHILLNTVGLDLSLKLTAICMDQFI
ncbi:hypothetical protein DSUL_50292 [Desulfovibrionales bacterium]